MAELILNASLKSPHLPMSPKENQMYLYLKKIIQKKLKLQGSTTVEK